VPLFRTEDSHNISWYFPRNVGSNCSHKAQSPRRYISLIPPWKPNIVLDFFMMAAYSHILEDVFFHSHILTSIFLILLWRLFIASSFDPQNINLLHTAESASLLRPVVCHPFLGELTSCCHTSQTLRLAQNPYTPKTYWRDSTRMGLTSIQRRSQEWCSHNFTLTYVFIGCLVVAYLIRNGYTFKERRLLRCYAVWLL
jgi:hypothetical protein